MNKLNAMLKRARVVLRQDSAENSIMQTISIAVSAILIAAGLITAPGLINNAKDTNAKSDLSNVSYSEEFFNSNNGGYVGVNPTAGTNIVTASTFAAGAAPNSSNGNVKINFASKTAVGVQLDGVAGYVAAMQSASGNVFVRIGTGSATYLIGKYPIANPSTVALSNAVLIGAGIPAASIASSTAFAAGSLTEIQ